MRESVQQVRSALLGGDAEGLQGLLGRQDLITRASAELRQVRENLRGMLGFALHLAPEAVTFEKIIAAARGPVRERLGQARVRLRQLGAEIEQVNHRNAVLLNYTLTFFERLFRATLNRGAGERYGPAGKRQEHLCHSLLEARG